jgi:hypothetical protein
MLYNKSSAKWTLRIGMGCKGERCGFKGACTPLNSVNRPNFC